MKNKCSHLLSDILMIELLEKMPVEQEEDMLLKIYQYQGSFVRK